MEKLTNTYRGETVELHLTRTEKPLDDIFSIFTGEGEKQEAVFLWRKQAIWLYERLGELL